MSFEMGEDLDEDLHDSNSVIDWPIFLYLSGKECEKSLAFYLFFCFILVRKICS